MTLLAPEAPRAPRRLISGSAAAVARDILAGVPVSTVHIPELLQSDIDGLVAGLKRFVAEVPYEERLQWKVHVPRDPMYDEPDDGVITKDRENGVDRKHYLHLRPDTEFLLRSKAGIQLRDWQRTWFAHGLAVRSACVRRMSEIVAVKDTLQPGSDFKQRVLDATLTHQHVLRCVLYDPNDEPITAKEHTDRNGLTFHLAESSSGLWANVGGGKLPLHTPSVPEALCFAGDQLARLTNGRVPALIHGVDNGALGQQRWAVVFFGKMFPELLQKSRLLK